jgi:hypothetical protein
MFDSEGNISNDSTKKFAIQFLEAFAEWVMKFNEGLSPEILTALR